MPLLCAFLDSRSREHVAVLTFRRAERRRRLIQTSLPVAAGCVFERLSPRFPPRVLYLKLIQGAYATSADPPGISERLPRRPFEAAPVRQAPGPQTADYFSGRAPLQGGVPPHVTMSAPVGGNGDDYSPTPGDPTRGSADLGDAWAQNYIDQVSLKA